MSYLYTDALLEEREVLAYAVQVKGDMPFFSVRDSGRLHKNGAPASAWLSRVREALAPYGIGVYLTKREADESALRRIKNRRALRL